MKNKPFFILILYIIFILFPIEIITLEFMGFLGHVVCLLYLFIFGFLFASIGLWITLALYVVAIIISLNSYPAFMTILLIAVPLLYIGITVLPIYFSKDK